MTFDYSSTKVGQPPAELFDLPPAYTHADCEKHMGGFPYLHIFHYFVRF